MCMARIIRRTPAEVNERQPGRPLYEMVGSRGAEITHDQTPNRVFMRASQNAGRTGFVFSTSFRRLQKEGGAARDGDARGSGPMPNQAGRISPPPALRAALTPAAG